MSDGQLLDRLPIIARVTGHRDLDLRPEETRLGIADYRVPFADRATQDFYDGVRSKAARTLVPPSFAQKALDKLTILDAATSLDRLRIPLGNKLEALRADRFGQRPIRVNDRYRSCFCWTAHGAVDVEIVDYHP